MDTLETNIALARLLKRAEDEERSTLVETFVDVSALYSRMSNRDSQVMFGRRGTGKTHALTYLSGQLGAENRTVVFLDLRTVGSSGGIYGDPTVSISEGGTRLLLDVLGSMHEALVDRALEAVGKDGKYEVVLPLLDKLADEISQVEVVGEIETSTRTMSADESSSSGGLNLNASVITGASIGVGASNAESFATSSEREYHARGTTRHRVHFGAIGSLLGKIVENLPRKQLWLLLDEWSHVPQDLQPLLADLIRHCLLPVHGLIVKIAAIELRSNFRTEREEGGYVGFELGADIAGDLDLDGFMVFGNDQDSATTFMATLLFRHVESIRTEINGLPTYMNPKHFLASAFASSDTFVELVRAAEGVPRDLINIVGKAALKADSRKIRRDDIREAARSWYMADKELAVKKRPDARALLHWIIDQVIGGRRLRGFILEQSVEHKLIDYLYDARLLHITKRGIAAKDRPGIRFDAYALDFGCYVDMLATREAAPRGMFETGEGGIVDVPPDDTEQIRNAILDLDAFPGDPALTARNLTRTGEPIYIESNGVNLKWFGGPDQPITNHAEVAFDGSGWYVVVQVEGRFGAVPLDRNSVRVGSSSNDHLRIRHQSVSPKHARLTCVENEVSVRTERGLHLYVNNRRVTNASLQSGDVVTIGRVHATIVYVDVDDVDSVGELAAHVEDKP